MERKIKISSDKNKREQKDFLDFITYLFNLLEKFRNLKAILTAIKLNLTINNLEEKNSEFLSSYKNSKIFGFIFQFIKDKIIIEKKSIKSINFYHYLIQAWFITLASCLKDSSKNESNFPSNFNELFSYVKNFEINEQIFFQNLEIISGTYKKKDNFIEFSEFKLAKNFLKNLKILLKSEKEIKNSWENLKDIIDNKNLNFLQEENFSNFTWRELIFGKKSEKMKEIDYEKENFYIKKSEFLFLMKDIFDKVVNLSLNELDLKENNKENLIMNDTFKSLLIYKENSFDNFDLKEKESNLQSIISIDKTYDSEDQTFVDISSNKQNDYFVSYEEFLKELKRTENIDNISFNTRNTSNLIDSRQEILDLDYSNVDTNEITSDEVFLTKKINSEIELLNPKEIFYNFAIVSLKDLLEDLDILNSKAENYLEKFISIMKFNYKIYINKTSKFIFNKMNMKNFMFSLGNIVNTNNFLKNNKPIKKFKSWINKTADHIKKDYKYFTNEFPNYLILFNSRLLHNQNFIIIKSAKFSMKFISNTKIQIISNYKYSYNFIKKFINFLLLEKFETFLTKKNFLELKNSLVDLIFNKVSSIRTEILFLNNKNFINSLEEISFFIENNFSEIFSYLKERIKLFKNSGDEEKTSSNKIDLFA